MLKINQVLISPVDFDNAMFFGIKIGIFQESEQIDYVGVIKKHTGNKVFLNEGYYLKQLCVFRVLSL
ncbi:hypothetical protein SAMN02799630_00221 [Paenibacillus sp. UNCCL117]|uniref:hypothetical protein n=1 Tax=unclassified Paenibacillus TaxID=185978 RepID=UPI000890F34B|nr:MULTISPECIES: hypothetical protein [unclassified Paenibacillus]SDC47867.1 hypothetical protein SAMN04488602_102310 [Paenibacillus sp. cl123]SFW12044.1 hypothetical protein SAMN02799630_00221 [Paenibacillus sp. UNCCL117]